MKRIVLFLLATCIITIRVTAQTDESAKFDWKKVVVGGGGYVTGVVFSEAQKDVIYCRTDVGGAYRWDQTNTAWIQLFDGVGRSEAGQRCIESIATDPTDANRVYIAGGGWTGDATGGVFWSTDQGKTLNYVNTPFKMAGNDPGRGIGERMQVDPNSPNIIYFGSRIHGLFKSTDYAKTWTKIASFPVTTTADNVGLCIVTFDPKSSTAGIPTKDIYVAVSQKGNNIYKSSDAGANWSLVAGTPTDMQPHGSVIDPSGNLYLSYGDGTGPGVDGTGKVWKYNTKTLTWTDITPAGSWGGFGGISIDKQKPNTVMVATAINWGGGAKIYRSPDAGATWKTVSDNWNQQPLDAPYLGTGTGNWIESLRIDPYNSDRVMYCTGAGIWVSSDVTLNDANKTTHWLSAVKGIEEAGAYHILSAPSGAELFTLFGDIGGFRHVDITVSPANITRDWFGWNYGHGIDYAQNDPNLMARNGGWTNDPWGYYSINNGISWTKFATTPPNAGGNSEKIHISANGTYIVWAPENSIPYYTNNKGASWIACQGVTAGSNSMTSDRVNDKKFYYYNQTNGYVYISTDGGINYTQGAFAGYWGQRIIANPLTEGDIWIPIFGQGTSGIFHSTNSGTSFTKLTTVQEASSVSLGKTAPGKTYPTIFINGKINNQWGIYYSIDQGVNWARINDDAHEYGWIDFVVADQRVFGRVFLSPNCMGIPYSQLKTTTATISVTLASSATTPCFGTAITLTATPTLTTGIVTKVDFYDGTTLLATDNTAPYVYTWTNASAGAHSIKAIATSSTTETATSTISLTFATGTAIVPYIQTNGGTWLQQATSQLCTGGSVNIGPQPNVTTGWSWTGPNGYTASTREIALATLVATQGGKYTASYNDGTCVSTADFTVTVNTIPSAPIVISPITYNQNATATALTATGAALLWYTVATAGTALTNAPTPSTATIGTTNYYVSQTVNTCESPRAQLDVIVKNAVVKQTIVLKAGWNLISTNVTPTDSTISTLFTGLDVQEIKTMDAFWRKGQNTVFNKITTIEAGKGYFVYMNIAGNLSVTGLPLTFVTYPSIIKKGWQLIGCPFQTSNTLSAYFNITNSLSVKNFDGFWMPSGTTNSISTLDQGKGYLLNAK
jgi:hypothetical protein